MRGTWLEEGGISCCVSEKTHDMLTVNYWALCYEMMVCLDLILGCLWHQRRGIQGASGAQIGAGCSVVGCLIKEQ